MPPRKSRDEAALATVAQQSTPSNALTVAEAQTRFVADLEARHSELATKLAGSYDPRYFAGLVLTQVRRMSPDVQLALASTPQGRTSLVAAAYQAAELGLPFLMGRAWLVPYRNNGVQEVQFQVGYQGLVDLVTGPETNVTFVEAGAVRARDAFDYQRGSGAYLRHREYMPPLAADAKQDEYIYDRGPRTYYWARVVFANGQERWDVMPYAEVEAIRKRSRARDSGPWVTDFDEMGKKTVLRRLCKTLPISLRAMEAIDRDDEIERAEPVQVGESAQSNLRQQVAARVTAPQATRGTSTPPAPVSSDVEQPSAATAQPVVTVPTPEPAPTVAEVVDRDGPTAGYEAEVGDVVDGEVVEDEDALLDEALDAIASDRTVTPDGEILEPGGVVDEPTPEPDPVEQAKAQIRETLAAPAKGPEQAKAPAATGPTATEAQQCDSISPWGSNEQCRKAAGHAGAHRTASESW